jgi:O-succinylbenzoic acid--CoA ligase
MHDWLSQRARVTPEREALVVADTGSSWDYGTLDESVDEMAGRLAAHGVGAGDHVGCVLEAGAPQVCLVHATMRLGAVLVPFAPSFTAPELQARMDRADVSLVVCGESTEQTVVEAATEETDQRLSILTIGDPQWTEVTSLGELESVAVTPYTWDREDVQLLLFTSGTTGDPKVVQLTMGNLLASAIASGFRLGVDPGDRWLVPLSLHHMGGIAPVLRSTLYGTTAIVRTKFDPGRTVDDIQTHDATAISLVPTMLRRMLSARGTLPDCLRFVLVGGAPCPVELVERCRNFSVPICPTYGMTETASQVATARHREAYETPATVGRPLMWTDVTIVGDDGRPMPPGESGELVVAGPTVSPGYYGDDEATAAASGEFGFHTGDVARFDEKGRLYVLNRLDDRIISGGENVDPGEVADALLTHPGVEEAAVVGLPDEEWGERVGALIVAGGEEQPLVGELESHLRERLAGFKLPRTVGFTEELPRTVSGTVERAAVREQLLEGTTGAIEYAEPSDEEATDEVEGDTESQPGDVVTGDAGTGDTGDGESSTERELTESTEGAGERRSEGETTGDPPTDDDTTQTADAVRPDADSERSTADSNGQVSPAERDAQTERSDQDDGGMEFGKVVDDGTPSPAEARTQSGVESGPRSKGDPTGERSETEVPTEQNSEFEDPAEAENEPESGDEQVDSDESAMRTEESQANEN